jgi:5-methylcytosine-specific restriction endonuclease McrA
MNIQKRIDVFEKYGGKCAYCGCDITIKNFQVDHVWPQHLARSTEGVDNNRLENLNPACRKCNNYKSGMKIDEFRKELQEQVARLRGNAQFDRAIRYRQIIIQESPIIFYFERIYENK